jgi:hypothetical protein
MSPYYNYPMIFSKRESIRYKEEQIKVRQGTYIGTGERRVQFIVSTVAITYKP